MNILVFVQDNYHLTQIMTVVMKDSIPKMTLVSKNAQWIGITGMVQVKYVNVLVNHAVKTYVLKIGKYGITMLLLVNVLIT
jgi:2-methylaconitate cis-trans-isomerase PrpF